MGKCSVCNKEFDDKYFDVEQNKCILHCEKDDKNGWYTFGLYNKKEWNPEKVKLFWKKADDGVDSIPHKSKIPPLLNHNLTYNLDIFDCEILDDFLLTANQKAQYPSINISLTTLKGRLIINMILGQKDNDIQISLLDNKHQDMIKIQGSANFDLFFSNIDVEMIDLSSRDKEIFVNRFSRIDIRNNNLGYKIKKLNLKDAIVYGKFTMNKVNLDYFNCSGSIFEKKVEIKESAFDKTSFYKNTKFKSLCDFYKTKFHCNNFTKTTFEDIVVFTESKFHENVNFKYTTFEKLALFRKTIFEKTVNFEDAIIKEEANFLEITSKEDKIEAIDVKNRETARIIKNSFEQQNNIIEANRFYALEMKKREDELLLEFKNKEKRNLKTFVDYFIFKLHGISSNHSQDPFLALYWIIIFGMTASLYEIYLHYTCSFSFINIITINLFLVSPVIINRLIEQEFDKYDKYYLAILYFLSYCFVISNCSPIECENTMSFAKTINPFSIMKGTDDIDILQLLFKITIAYLIYQFIVSVRQNTRRK
jgi:uncharacterized protein YjbI with pentapeptide repeats